MLYIISITMSINKKFFDYIIKHAKKLCFRKLKYTHEYYLINIL